MRKNLWIVAGAVVIVLGATGYTLAHSAGSEPQTGRGGPGAMMGPGMGMMGGGMMGQPLTQEQLEQFAKQHGISEEQAKQMTDACTQIMAGTGQQQSQ